MKEIEYVLHKMLTTLILGNEFNKITVIGFVVISKYSFENIWIKEISNG
jgi:hypothetical protein